MHKTTTLNYYNLHAPQFTTDTQSVDMSHAQTRFLEKIPAKSHILDFGCGSGRDTKHFLSQGYQVTAIDGSEELCKVASAHTGIPVKHMYFQDLDEISVYDAIWACSSILHLSWQELHDVLPRMANALVPKGIVYTSFKYSDFEGERNGRYFTDLREDRLQQLLEETNCFTLEDYWITSDVRPGREDEKWLNVILRKKS